MEEAEENSERKRVSDEIGCHRQNGDPVSPNLIVSPSKSAGVVAPIHMNHSLGRSGNLSHCAVFRAVHFLFAA